MKNLRFVFAGVIFGIIMVKSEAVSWYRIQEMFRFQSFHMYGIIGSAVAVSALFVQVVKRLNMTDLDGHLMKTKPRTSLPKATLVGGFIFGIGWAFTGACPGPLFVNLGAGYTVMMVPISTALLGALAYGLLAKKLPH